MSFWSGLFPSPIRTARANAQACQDFSEMIQRHLKAQQQALQNQALEGYWVQLGQNAQNNLQFNYQGKGMHQTNGNGLSDNIVWYIAPHRLVKVHCQRCPDGKERRPKDGATL